MWTPSDELLQALHERGLTMKPINRDKYAIKDEPKWKIVKIEE